MFRTIRFLILLIVILLIAFGLYFWKMRISLVENFLSKQLHTKVSVEDVKISWNSLFLEHLTIQNGELISFQGNLKITANLFALFKQPMQLKQVEIRDAILTLELFNGVGSDNNWIRLLSLLPAQQDGQKLIIDKLIVENLRFEIKRPNGKLVTVPPISHLEFDNLGKGAPLTVSQIVRIVFQSILSNLRDKPFLGNVLDNIAPLPASHLKGTNASHIYKQETKGIFAEGLEVLKRKTQEATGYLQDLFSN